jgi:hypothetical protein
VHADWLTLDTAGSQAGMAEGDVVDVLLAPPIRAAGYKDGHEDGQEDGQ